MRTATDLCAGVRVLCVAVALGAGAGPLSPSAARAQSAPIIKSVGDVKALLTPALPGDAEEIEAAMTGAEAGQTVTVRGYIPDAKDAFNDGSAEFVLVQAPADPAAHRATIRVLNSKGEVLKGGLKGEHGLKPGAEVFATGRIASANGKDALVLNVVSLHVPRAPLPAGFFTEASAGSARDVSEARKAGGLKVGDEVILRGRVGGSKEPFVAGRAVFTLVGRGLKACNENPDDKCSKPWDYCCETRADILANSVSVQVVDGRSQVLRTDMKGRRGLKELSEVVVVGRVASADGKAVVINATAMSVSR